MTGEKRLAELDERFVSFYEATRHRLLDEQKARALVLVSDDHIVLYHGSKAPKIMAGLRPPLYEKLKTLSHVLEHFDDDAIVELTGLIASQNLSSKFNSALGVPPQGFCTLPIALGRAPSAEGAHRNDRVAG